MVNVLNAYSGIGANRKKWQNVNVTAIEIDSKIANVYSKFYPNDTVIVTDAKNYILEHYQEFDFIWASPPCQSNSKMAFFNSSKKRKYPDLSIYELFIFLNKYFKGKFCIENVIPYYKPLIRPTIRIGRHIFWANFEIYHYNPPKLTGFMDFSTKKESIILKKWLDMEYDETLYYNNNNNCCQVLRNCVHPFIGEHIFKEYKRTGLFYDI